MKKQIIHILIILIGFTSANSNAQNYTEFETELIKHHGIKDTLVGDNLWIYDKKVDSIKKIELDIYANKQIETYLVDMTWFLGYHINHVKCLFAFNTKTKELQFVGEIWCNGFKPNFYNNLIGYSLPNKKTTKKFVADFEKLVQVNNSEVKFENIYFETNRTTFYQTDYMIPKKKRQLWRIVVLNHPKGILTSINIINPNSKSGMLIK